MELSHRTYHFLQYLIRAKTKYYLHSPFIYQFYLHVLEGETHTSSIEALRARLLSNSTAISFTDLGKNGDARTKKIEEIAATSSITKRYGEVLYRAAKYFKPKHTLELGTNLGLGTAYLATGNENGTVFTVEGSPEIQQLAKQNLESISINNVSFINGNFDNVLPEVVSKIPTLDLVFIDGNHRYQPTIDYFETCLKNINENSVIIIDDIYWSKEMTEAWNYIKAHESVTLSADIYRMGFVFFRPQQLAKEHFRLLLL
jgi:predicted O-methyltransferase YrrM